MYTEGNDPMTQDGSKDNFTTEKVLRDTFKLNNCCKSLSIYG